MNETQVNAMLQSLTHQLNNANIAIAQRDGEIAMLREQLSEFEKQQKEAE